MKHTFRLLAGLITVAACGFFLWHLVGSAREIGSLVRSMPLGRVIPGFIASSLLFVLIYPLTGSMFPSLLSAPGPVLARSTSIGILATSQLARYVPGNIGQHIARGGMLTVRGFPMGAIVPALMIEAILSVMAACATAALAVLAFPLHGSLPLGWPWLAGVLAVGVVALLAFRFGPLLAPRIAERFPALSRSLLVSPATAARCIAVYALNYVFVGLGLYLVARVVVPDAGPLGGYIGAFALSWIVGFLAPGLPAGLGVREGVLVALLEPALGTSAAVTIAGIHRISTTVGDALAAGLGGGLLWASRRDQRRSD